MLVTGRKATKKSSLCEKEDGELSVVAAVLWIYLKV